MKFSPQIVAGLTILILGMVLVIAGAFLKIHHYSHDWITGDNLIIIGMAVELLGIFLAAAIINRNLKK
ncbi:MAG TPA: hypothetical protein VKY36_05135 [Moheibacter sp.]|nr:hypothetical protein [Moheibacter sp.]